MKVILTETQMNALLLEERLAWILKESLNESTSFDEMKKKIRKALSMGVAVATILTAVANMNLSNIAKRQLIDYAKNTEMVNDSLYAQKVKDCEEYMKFALKNQGYSLESTGLKPETLVKASMETGFDLPFMMAAAHLESCFGATPRARRTNSVFSVGSYDNGKDVVTYADPNDSVDGYINLLNNHYLIDGKTIFDLMKPGNFVNEIGKRYASDKNYEGKIKSIRNLILKKFPNLA